MSVLIPKAQAYYDKMEQNPLGWGYFMFPNHFRDQFPQFHVEIIDNAMLHRRLAVVAPRDHAKSTLISFLYAFHQAMFKKCHYILLVGNTEDKSAEHISSMASEIRTNNNLKLFHGKVRLKKDSKDSIIIKHEDGFETLVLSIGIKEIPKKRGTKFGAYRPDLIILDDVDDDELVKNPERRRDLQKDIDTALFPAGDAKLCRYVAVGTVIHDDCQIAKMVNPDNYPGWQKLFYRAVINEETGQVLWKERKSFDELMMIKKHSPLTYAKEYQNDPITGEAIRFKPEMFKNWKRRGADIDLYTRDGEKELTYRLTDCTPAISCDLAWSERKEADESVLLSGLLTPRSDILVFNYLNKRGWRPESFIEALFSEVKYLHEITGTKPAVGFEKAMLEKVTLHILKREMRARNYFITTKDLKWGSDKVSRIEVQLEPRYSQGTIYHKVGMGDLEHQLMRFPSGTHDDIIDALQGLCQMLNFPKSKAKEVTNDTQFDWLRKHAIPNKNNTTETKRLGQFLLGKKIKPTITFRETFK